MCECIDCKEDKPDEDFPVRHTDGYQYKRCKACTLKLDLMRKKAKSRNYVDIPYMRLVARMIWRRLKEGNHICSMTLYFNLRDWVFTTKRMKDGDYMEVNTYTNKKKAGGPPRLVHIVEDMAWFIREGKYKIGSQLANKD